MKNLIIVLMLLISVQFLSAQDLYPSFETYFENKSTHLTVNFQMYPVSAIYNGDNELCLIAKLKKFTDPDNRFDYNSGTQILNRQKQIITKVLPGETCGFNFDMRTSGPPFNTIGSFSRGIYKMIAYIENPSQSGYIFLDSVIIETDALGNQDLYIYYVDDLSLYGGEHKPGLTFKSTLPEPGFSWGPEIPTTFTNKYINSWCPYPLYPNLPQRQKDFGNFTYSNGNTVLNPYKKFPLFSNRDCNLPNIPEQNQNFSELNSREGRITLNTTFDKKLSTPFEYPNTINQNQNVALTVEPNVLFKVNGGLYQEENLIINKGFIMFPYSNGMGNDLYVKSPDASINNTITTFEIASSETYDANARIKVNQNCNIIIEQNAKIIIGKYADLFFEVDEAQSQGENGGKMTLKNNSIIVLKENSNTFVYAGGKIINEGAGFNCELNANISVAPNGEYFISNNVTNNQIISNGAKMTLLGGKLRIGNNSILIFDGQGTHLTVNQGSTIQLGHNAKIEFRNGAYLESNGSVISSMDGANPAAGLVFENAGASTITNCTFNNITNPIYISNSSSSTQYILHTISGNIFNMNNSSIYGIHTINTNNIIISNNNINMQPGVGIGLLLYYPDNILDESLTCILSDNITIINNTVSGSQISAAIENQTSSCVSLNFINNSLSGSISTQYNLLARNVTGYIKNNTLTGADESMQFYDAAPNIFGNYIQSRDLSIYAGYSSPNLSPKNINQSSDNGLVWLGGQNKIYSVNDGNINFVEGLPLLDWGQNCFSKISSSAYYHLSGTITTNECYVRNNDFNALNNPVSLLTGPNGGVVIPYYYGSNFGCINSTDRGQIWQINNLGGGFYDTIYKTPATNQNPPAEDEAKYSGAILKKEQKSYFDAISEFKMLINNYPQSGYTDGCLYDLYESYKGLDTSSLQSNRDIIFTDLENYLNGKIQSGLYSDNFNMTAYEITAMCKVNILDYNEAMSSYEFISLYHPDAYIRLLASWDYAEVQALLNGSGNGISSNPENRINSKTVLSDAEYKDKLIKKINKSISIDPSKQQVKKSFDRQKEKSLKAAVKSEIEKNGLDNEKARKKIESIRKTEEDKSTSKVISVMRNTRNMTKAEREKRQVEDVIFGAPQHSGKKETGDNTNSLPVRYELSQNYPNPFNPVTKINFAIQKQGLVTLKVYDMLGREVASLVNEFKQAGYYSLDFNASGLSSGIYFYRLQANDFTDIKKMVLIK
jgi:tetratricopeptide (TPR) repeat protein